MKLHVSSAIAVLATGLVATSAKAGIPVVSVRVQQVGAGSIELVPVGTPQNDGGYGYSGDVSVWGFLANFDLRAATKSSTLPSCANPQAACMSVILRLYPAWL